MVVRIRYFHYLFLLLVFAILLLVPYYYSDTWTPSVWSPPQPPKSGIMSAPVTGMTPWKSSLIRTVHSQQYSNEVQEDIRRGGGEGRRGHAGQLEYNLSSIAAVPINNTPTTTTVLPQIFPPMPRIHLWRYKGTAHEINHNFSKLHPRIKQYALQMARDRLQIEKYGSLWFRGGNQSFHFIENKYGREQQWQSNDTKSLPTSPPHLQIIIVTYFRGGTTFFGDALNQYPGVYYHFEPLHTISFNDQVRTPEQREEAMRLLNHLLQCQYSAVPSYINWVSKGDNRFLFEHNRRLWMSCQLHPHLCFDYEFLSDICNMHPVHVFKLVRLRLELAKSLLDKYPDLRVIYLARDPRGLYSSRRDLAWCNSTTSCIDPVVYCEDMRRDLRVAKYLNSKYKKRFMAIRYEDVALDPSNQLKKVFDFLKLDYNSKVEHFIESHTHLRAGEDAGGPYSTKRDSRKAAFSWRYRLSPHEIDYVEFSCTDVIKQLALSL